MNLYGWFPCIIRSGVSSQEGWQSTRLSVRKSSASLSQVLLFCAHVKSSAFNPISAKITFSLHSDNLLIHYLAGNFCIVIKDTGQLVIGYFSPLLDGREVPLWACRQFKFKSRSPANVISITGRQVSGVEWQVELHFAHLPI